MTIDIYYSPGSSPCRAVLLAAKAIGVDVNLKHIDAKKGEHRTPEFLKLNPQHTVPTIDDNGFGLWESRAIMTYLQNTYGKDDSIYPKDPKTRAVIDQRLYFDIGTLYSRFGDYYYPIIAYKASPDPGKLEKLNQALEILDTFLTNSEYAVGNNITLADLALVASVSSIDAVGHDLSPYNNVIRWYEKVQATAPGYEEANGKNVRIFKEGIDKMRKQ